MKLFTRFKNYLLNLLKTCKLKICGIIFTWIIPLVFIIYDGTKINVVKKIKFELWAIPALLIILIIYYKKIKQKLHDYFLIKGIHGVPLGPIYYLVTTVFNVLTLYAVYMVIKIINAINADILEYLLICSACFILGGICNIWDSINQMTIGGLINDIKK